MKDCKFFLWITHTYRERRLASRHISYYCTAASLIRFYPRTAMSFHSPHKPRLLYVITYGHWGGAQKYIYDLAAALAGQFEVTVAVGDPEGAKDLQFQIANFRLQIDIVQLKHLKRAISPLDDLRAVFAIRRLYKTIKPDLIHLNSSKAGVLGSLAKINLQSEICNLKLIYTAHGWVFDEPLPWLVKRLYRVAEKVTARAKDAIIVLSEHDRQTAAQTLGVPAHKLALIQSGIAPPALFPRPEARSALGLATNGFIIGAIANHYRTKGLDVLLEAAASLKKEINNFHLVIIGDGPERPRLEAIINALNLQSAVTLTGFLPEAAKYLPAFDIFVLPSRKEGFPFTLLEAMAAGLPIIAASVGGVPEMITDDEQGIIVPPGSPDALRSAIKRLNDDPGLRQRLGDNARRRAAGFSLAQQIKATTTLYRSLMARRTGESPRQ